MRKVILQLAMSRDGFIADENGGVDWLDADVDLSPFSFEDFLAGIDTLMMGRKSYEKSLSFGPWHWGAFDTYVFSRSGLTPKTPRTFAESRAPAEWLKELRGKPGKNLWLFGGGELNRAFLEAGLIDEAQIFAAPVDLGKGLGLFGSAPLSSLALKERRTLPNGWVELGFPK